MFNSDESPLIEASYGDLRQLARRMLASERPGHTLQPTALVHEVYCRLRRRSAACDASSWEGRDHFMAAAAEAMRRILVEHARRRLSLKRGGNRSRQPVEVVSVELPLDAADLLAVHEALDQLAEEDSLAAELVKLRIFAGFNHIESAEHLGLNKSRADRVWAFAKARLFTLMEGRREA